MARVGQALLFFVPRILVAAKNKYAWAYGSSFFNLQVGVGKEMEVEILERWIVCYYYYSWYEARRSRICGMGSPACILRLKQEEFKIFYAAYFKVST
jgi:hypothetical protein